MTEGVYPNANALLTLDLVPQPDDTSCGPTCLHGLYRYYGEHVSLSQLVADITSLETGGTLAVHLGIDALRRGYKARIYTYNLRIFDPTWFTLGRPEMLAKLRAREALTADAKRAHATSAYIEFLENGGEVRMHDLNASLLRKYLRRKVPILTGLSSTYLYQTCRETLDTCADDDVGGEPSGHFVVLTGYDSETREAHVVDPYHKDTPQSSLKYSVKLDRLVTAILLGLLTYDANLLIVRPRHWGEGLHDKPDSTPNLGSAC
jgi:hypothetical protein